MFEWVIRSKLRHGKISENDKILIENVEKTPITHCTRYQYRYVKVSGLLFDYIITRKNKTVTDRRTGKIREIWILSQDKQATNVPVASRAIGRVHRQSTFAFSKTTAAFSAIFLFPVFDVDALTAACRIR